MRCARRALKVDVISLQTFMVGFAVVLVTGAATADPTQTPARMLTRADVDRVCDNASSFAEANASEVLTFWDVTAGLIPAAGHGLWWRVDDIARSAVVDSLGAHGPNAQVSVWRIAGGALHFHAFFTSDSGDWAYFVEYCYRPDGKVARTWSTFNSFVAADVPGGIRRERTRYFDAKGKVTYSRSTVWSLESGAKLRIHVTGNDEPSHMTVDTWPLYPLLSDALGTHP
jgi:hypothetical protein